MIVLNHHWKGLSHSKVSFFCQCDTLFGSPVIGFERCRSSPFIVAFSIDRSQNLRVFVPWKVCFLKYIVFFGQYINRIPCIFCFFIAMFRITWLNLQEKLLARSLFVNHFDFPGSASRDVTMAMIIVRAISVALNTSWPLPPGRRQSRAQSFSGSLSAVGRRDKLWDNEIFVPEIVGHHL